MEEEGKGGAVRISREMARVWREGTSRSTVLPALTGLKPYLRLLRE
jgi:hypothetical protein